MQYKFYVKDFEKELYYKKGLYGNFSYNKYDYYVDKDYPSYFCMFDSTEVNNKLEYENMMLELEKGYSYDRKNVVLNGRCYSITYGEKPNIVTIQGGIGFPSNIKIDQPEYVELEPIDLSLEEYKNFLFKNKSIEGLKENRYIRKFKETTKLTPYMKDIIKDRAILDFEDGTPLSDDEALDWFSTEKDIPQELVTDAAIYYILSYYNVDCDDEDLEETFKRSNRKLKERNFKDLQSDDEYELTKEDIMEGVREQAYDYIFDDMENDNIRTEDEMYEFFKNYVHDKFYLERWPRTSAKYYAEKTKLYTECNKNYYENWDIDSVLPIMNEIRADIKTYCKDAAWVSKQLFPSKEAFFAYLDKLLDAKEKGTPEGDVKIFELNVKPKLYLPHENYKEQHYAHDFPGSYDIDLYTLPEKYHSLIDDSFI